MMDPAAPCQVTGDDTEGCCWTDKRFPVMGGVDFVDLATNKVQGVDSPALVEGLPQHERYLNGYVFVFLSSTNAALFEADPWRYAPAFGGFCSYGVAVEAPSPYFTSGELWMPSANMVDPAWFRRENTTFMNKDVHAMDNFFTGDDIDARIAQGYDDWQRWWGRDRSNWVFNTKCCATSTFSKMAVCARYSPSSDGGSRVAAAPIALFAPSPTSHPATGTAPTLPTIGTTLPHVPSSLPSPAPTQNPAQRLTEEMRTPLPNSAPTPPAQTVVSPSRVPTPLYLPSPVPSQTPMQRPTAKAPTRLPNSTPTPPARAVVSPVPTSRMQTPPRFNTVALLYAEEVVCVSIAVVLLSFAGLRFRQTSKSCRNEVHLNNKGKRHAYDDEAAAVLDDNCCGDDAPSNVELEMAPMNASWTYE